MDKSISIILRTPDYGWLPVTFRYQEFNLDFYASNVLNDPVEELLDIAYELKDKEKKRITWWREAPAYFFDVEKNGNSYCLTISETTDLLKKTAENKLILTITGTEKEIIEPLRVALQQFAELEYERSHWYREK